MSFEEALAQLPQWVQHWMNFIALVLALSAITFLIVKTTRWLGAYMVVSTIALFVIMTWLYNQMGMVRLLGIVHIVFWTPLVVYLWRRLRGNPPQKYVALLMWLLLATLTVALVFDYYDVLRWVMGERASII